MKILRGHLYVVDFNPRIKTKPGKLRPAIVVQEDLINDAGYPSTIVVRRRRSLRTLRRRCGYDCRQEPPAWSARVTRSWRS